MYMEHKTFRFRILIIVYLDSTIFWGNKFGLKFIVIRAGTAYMNIFLMEQFSFLGGAQIFSSFAKTLRRNFFWGIDNFWHKLFETTRDQNEKHL